MSKRILVVDDLEDDLEAMVDVVQRLIRHDAIEAKSGQEAIRLAERTELDLILIDLHMPPLDGWEVVRVLRQIESCRDTPILAVTSYHGAIPGLRELAFTVGCNDYLTKPLDIDTFIETVSRHLSD